MTRELSAGGALRTQERLNRAEEAMFATTVPEIEDGIRALQSLDATVSEPELSRKLLLRLEAYKKREVAQKGRWGELVLTNGTGGLRHYLDGQPVHAGAGLVLQSVTFKDDDYGQYSVPLKEGTHVRYEAHFGNQQIGWSLFTSLGGHEFAAVGEGWMRFRWPERK